MIYILWTVGSCTHLQLNGIFAQLLWQCYDWHCLMIGEADASTIEFHSWFHSCFTMFYSYLFQTISSPLYIYIYTLQIKPTFDARKKCDISVWLHLICVCVLELQSWPDLHRTRIFSIWLGPCRTWGVTWLGNSASGFKPASMASMTLCIGTL